MKLEPSDISMIESSTLEIIKSNDDLEAEKREQLMIKNLMSSMVSLSISDMQASRD